MRFILFATAAVAAAPALAEPAAELSAGVEYQQGDYGTGERVETTTARAALRVEDEDFWVAASLPYQRLEAPGNVVGGGGLLGIIIDPTRPAEREVREGLGDLRVGGGWRLPRLAGVEPGLTAEVKLPTAADGLGTGELDFTVGAEAARSFGAVTPFVAVSYTVPGHPETFELRNAFAVRGGVAARLAPALRGTVAYGYAESRSPLVPDEQQVTTGLDIGLSRRLSLGVTGTAGLSDGSPDLGGALRLGWRID